MKNIREKKTRSRVAKSLAGGIAAILAGEAVAKVVASKQEGETQVALDALIPLEQPLDEIPETGRQLQGEATDVQADTDASIRYEGGGDAGVSFDSSGLEIFAAKQAEPRALVTSGSETETFEVKQNPQQILLADAAPVLNGKTLTDASDVATESEAPSLSSPFPDLVASLPFEVPTWALVAGTAAVAVTAAGGSGGSGSAGASPGSNTVPNTTPSTTDDSVAVTQNQSYTLNVSDFGTYVDAENTALAAVQFTSLATNGVLQLNNGTSWVSVTLGQSVSRADIEAGKLRFVPDQNETGSPYALIGFKVSDGTDWSASSYSLSVSVTANGSLADGYIWGATVFRDMDGDGVLDSGEYSATTDQFGHFSGLGGAGGTIVAYGGVDVSTGKAFEGVLQAPAGASVINPITTLVVAALGDTSGMSESQIAAAKIAAEAKIATILGIDPSLGSLSDLDPLALMAAGGQNNSLALNAQLAAIQAANVLVTITSAIQSAGLANGLQDASKLLTEALGQTISGLTNSGSLDFSDAALISNIFSAVADVVDNPSTASLTAFQAATFPRFQ